MQTTQAITSPVDHKQASYVINVDPITFFGKKQSVVEVNTFGSKYIASKIAVEYI